MSELDAAASAEALAQPSEEELRAFIGPRADRYWRKWGWAIQNGSNRAAGLFPPFFFGFVWFLYRRMYREVWVPFALIIVVVILEMAVTKGGETSRALETGLNFGIAAATSMVGSSLYLRKFRRAVAHARQTAPTPEARLEILRRAGGTSWIGLIIGVVSLILLLALAMVE